MRLKSLLILILLGSFRVVSAQIYDPVDWSFTAERTGEETAEVTFTAEVEKGWHLYSQHIEGIGPEPTSFSFETLNGATLDGQASEPKGHTEFDPNFEMQLTYHSGTVNFVQKLNLGASTKTVAGFLSFMVCNDERCLPPEDVDFSFDIPAFSGSESIDKSLAPSEQGHDDGNQIFDPVKWSFDQKDLGDGEFELSFSAKIEEHWHVYSMNLPEETMTIPTEFVFDSVIGAELVGGVVEPDPIKEFDPVAEEELSWFENEVTFTQKLKLTESKARVYGALQFMTCDDKRCLPPEWVEFTFELEGVASSQTTVDEDGSEASDKSWVGIFIAGFIGGLLALLTPCVFPMIPLTVSFFTKQSKTKAKGISNAIIYGLSIIGIYVLLGLAVTLTFGPDALNALSTNVWFNIFFFLLLVVFAFSFLGAFEITLPSSWINKADSAADQGGLVGIFFMAFTLSLVSFSCTGPIIGTLLVEAAVNGGVLGPTMGMIGFSSALALPFALFAAFPGWLNSMPKSGGWLNAVKVSLGFLELALAFKFLSNADLVMQAGLLKRELFIAIWIAVFGIWALYLLGFISLSHDSKSDGIGTSRLVIGVLVTMFTIYLIPGLWGAPLKIISGFPPPMFYSESPNGVGGSGGGGGHAAVVSESGEVVGDPEHCPHGLPCFHDYEEGFEYAKEAGKPVLLDFTGWACVNCRKMEEQVWSDPRVLTKLREDYVLISLYVDEKLPLPKEEQREVEYGGKKKKLRTIGNKWSYFQATKYGTNSQPYYVILDHNENQLGPSAAYDPDIDLYVNWLNQGLEKFEAGS